MPSLKLTLKPFRENRLLDILTLERECFKNPYSLQTLKREMELPHGINLIAETERGELAGYLMAWCLGETCELHRIATAPKLRKKGVAETLLKALLRESQKRGAKEVLLEVDSRNEAALNLYRKLGFKTVGERKNYYGPNTKALILKLTL